MPDDILWIADDDALREFCAAARAHPFVAFDTEFVRETTYYARLALVQLGTPEAIACIDPLAGLDMRPLDALLFDPAVLKVVHAGRQDVEIVRDRTGQLVAPLFDTQVAAALLGYGEQIGYANLVRQVTGVELGKAHQRADWLRRPLDAATIAYAADDVRHLREVFRQLEAQLAELDRRAWLDEEQAALADPATYEVEPAAAWLRLKGSNRLRGVACAVAQDLAAWREARARHEDRPRRRVLADDVLLDLAQRRPTAMGELLKLRNVERQIPKGLRGPLLDVVRAAAARPPDTWPEPSGGGGPATADDAVVAALGAVLEVQARAHQISAKLLATNGDLQRVAAGERDVPVLHGWRYELAGRQLLAFLAGEAQLAVADGALRLG